MSENNNQYSDSYTEDSFWEKIKNFALSAGYEVIEKRFPFYCAGKGHARAALAKVIRLNKVCLF